MRKMSASVLFTSLFFVSCSRLDEPQRRVLGADQDPALYTQVVEPDIFIVAGAPRPFGHGDLSALVVADSGSRRKTFVIPAAMTLKRGDVIKVYLLCYRAEESGVGALEVAKNACTDVVIPLQPDRR